MDVEQLTTLYPRLYHMAQADSWPAIREHGLMTTAQIMNTSQASADVCEGVLEQRRARSTVLEHPLLGNVVIRDQAPLREQFLTQNLTDMTVNEWLATLNSRVFFWLHPKKLGQLLSALRYRKDPHDVIIVDTASLLSAHGDRVRLSAINSGATLYPNAPARGTGTFLTVDAYPYGQYKARGTREAIVELAVIDGVSDILRHVVRVERRRWDEVVELLFERVTHQDADRDSTVNRY